MVCNFITHRSGTSEFFFFQAEDGIRDHCVTGVQTCALPISHRQAPRSRTPPDVQSRRLLSGARSEERRVGKECRSRWSPYPYKTKRERTGSRQNVSRARPMLTTLSQQSVLHAEWRPAGAAFV